MLALLIGPHWLLWRDLFDGAAVAFAAATGHRDGLDMVLRNANWPVALVFHNLCLTLGELTGASYLLFVKLTLSALLVGLYLELNRLARQLLALPPGQARLAALLASASPVLYTLASSQIVPLLLCVWLVFAGHRLYRGERLLHRAAGLVALVVSFQLNSNLVFALALECVWLARLTPALRRRRLLASAALLGSAVAVYATMRWLVPPAQLFTEYNQLLKPWHAQDLRRIARACAMFLTWGIIPLVVVGITTAVWALQRSPGRALAPGVRRAALARHAPAVLIAAFLCAAAAFPYVAVGKGAPLFTLRALGDGLTEQVLRSAHTGLFAPTWANSSGRHALLFGAAVGLLAWASARLAWAVLGGRRRPPMGAFCLALAASLAWVLAAYYNKLQTQFAEQSLVHGLKRLPPAPPGVVEVAYRPVTDWLIWSVSAGVILHEAWGKAPYWPSFYSVEAYRLDMQWQYHAYLLGQTGLARPAVQHYLGADGLPGADCISRYDAALPVFAPAQVLLAGLRPGAVPEATIGLRDTGCQPGRALPNPSPGKKIIP